MSTGEQKRMYMLNRSNPHRTSKGEQEKKRKLAATMLHLLTLTTFYNTYIFDRIDFI